MGHPDSSGQGPWCMACGYCLHGLAETSTACPECGGDLAEVAGKLPLKAFRMMLWNSYILALGLGFLIASAVGAFVAPSPQWDSTGYVHGSTCHEATVDVSVDSEAHQLVLGRALKIPLTRLSCTNRLSMAVNGKVLRVTYDPRTMTCRDSNDAGIVARGSRVSLTLVLSWLAQNAPELKARDRETEADEILRLATTVPQLGPDPESEWVTVTFAIGAGLLSWWFLCRRWRERLRKQLRISEQAKSRENDVHAGAT